MLNVVLVFLGVLGGMGFGGWLMLRTCRRMVEDARDELQDEVEINLMFKDLTVRRLEQQSENIEGLARSVVGLQETVVELLETTHKGQPRDGKGRFGRKGGPRDV